MEPLKNPIALDIEEHHFVSKYDGTNQTFLLKDFRGHRWKARSLTPLVVICLHGASTNQSQAMTAGTYGNYFGLLAIELQKRNAIYICPDYRGPHSWMGPAAESDLQQIIQIIHAQYQPAKLILMGGSMGGTSALIFGMLHAEMLDGIIAMCPATDMKEVYDQHPAWQPMIEKSYLGNPLTAPEEFKKRSSRYEVEALSQLPIAIMHGTADALLSVEHSRRLVGDLKSRGARFSYTEIEGGDHDSPLTQCPIGPHLDFVLALQ